jgi:hypothetical protein
MKQLILLFIILPSLLFSQKELTNLQQTQIKKNSFQLSWTSTDNGTPAVKYGQTKDLELGIQTGIAKSNFSYQVLLQNLQPATFYYAQTLLINGIDTLAGPINYYTTQSNSTGTIRVMFNQGIDPVYSTGSSPYILTDGANIQSEIISMINQATSTIDIAVYNNTRSAIVTALTTAHNNGIRVRYIANSGTTSNAALSPAPAFPVFYVNPTELMHNKFMVIDADSINTSWVWTGSCNWTYTDMYTNYNNIIAIQDQALAQAYVVEFEEMWGSNTAAYNTTLSKVGNVKTNNTPHSFNIGGKTVECYFSPSDNTSDEIEATLYSADYDIEFCILSFTRNELGTAIKNEHQAGIFEHGIMENISDIGSEYSYLTGLGVNLLADNHATDLHHKYAIIDAGNTASDPQVITGSHNWSSAAEEKNDENTLIIHDATIANLYLQEFTLRWCEVKNNINCTLPFNILADKKIEQEDGISIFPNPAQNSTTLQFQTAPSSELEAMLYTTTGQLVQTYELNRNQKEYQLDINTISNGLYFLLVQDDKTTWQLPITILK